MRDFQKITFLGLKFNSYLALYPILLFRLDITMDMSLNLEDVDVKFLLAEDADYTTSPLVLSSQEN